MITSKHVAAAVSSEAERFISVLNEALHDVRANASSADYERFKRAVGLVVGEMEVELLAPLYKLHPDLEPESVRKARDDS